MPQVGVAHSESVYVFTLKLLDLHFLFLEFADIELHSVVSLQDSRHQVSLFVRVLLEGDWVLICLHFEKIDLVTLDRLGLVALHAVIAFLLLY